MATSKRKKSASPAIEDIDHTDVPAQASAAPAVVQPQEAEVVTAEEDPEKTLALTIAREIKRFGLADAGIEELKKQYGELSIVDVNDKDGYELVKKAWNDVRGRRTGLEKKGLEIRGSYTKVTKAVKEEEDRLIRLVKPLEEDLYKKWKKVDDDKEAEKQRKLQEAEEKLQGRVQELLDAGAEFKLGYYGVGNTIAIDVATLREMPDDQFGTLKEAVVAKKAEVDAEAERQRQKQKEEDDQRAKDKLRLEELENQQKADAKAKRDLRLDLLEAVGMTISAGGKAVMYDNGFASHTIPMERVDAATDAEFKELVADAKVKIAGCKERMAQVEREKEEERKVLTAKKERINELLIDAGFSYQYAKDLFFFHNEVLNQELHMNNLVALSDDELTTLAAGMKVAIAEARTKQEEKKQREAQEREQQRQGGLNDKQLFEEYTDALRKIPLPIMVKTAEGKAVVNEFAKEFTAMLARYELRLQRAIPEQQEAEEAVPS